jgi:predicted SAM-dependent methyltransferase
MKEDQLPDGWLFCTHSQELTYFDSERVRVIARVHQYLRPDGTLAASGMPDPKMVCLGGVEYHLHRGTPRGALTPRQRPWVKAIRKVYRRLKHRLKVLVAAFKAFFARR